MDGKLYQVEMFTDIDKKFSIDSSAKRIDLAVTDLATSLGLSSNAFNVVWSDKSKYVLNRRIDDHNCEAPSGHRRFKIIFENRQLFKQLFCEQESRKRAEGEELPDAETWSKDKKAKEAENEVNERERESTMSEFNRMRLPGLKKQRRYREISLPNPYDANNSAF